jgi:hypothetical protein
VHRNHQNLATPDHQARPQPEIKPGNTERNPGEAHANTTRMHGSMDKESDQALGHLQDMYTTNTLFRREFGIAPRLVRDVAEEDTRRTWLVCEHLDLIMTVLVIHHQSQDACNGSFPRDPDRAGAVACGAEGDHARLHRVIDHVSTLMGTWRTSSSSLDAKPLAAALEHLALLLNDHMARREERILWPRTASLTS